jgi:hypothetical protein
MRGIEKRIFVGGTEMIFLSIALYVVAALLLAHGIFKGIKRGIIGQALRLGVNLIAATTALLVASGVSSAIAKAFGGIDLGALVSKAGVDLDASMSGAINSIETSTVASIVSLPVALLVVPVLTIIVYIRRLYGAYR